MITPVSVPRDNRRFVMRAPLCPLVLALLLIAWPTVAQDGPQRGRVKSFDAASGRITITDASGKDVEAFIVPQTTTRGADGSEIARFGETGVPAGTHVMFKVEEQGGRQVLVGLRIPPAGQQAKGKGKGQAAGKRPDVPPPPPPRDSIGVKPLTELGDGKYKGETGGLYGNGSNEPPPALKKAAEAAAARIQPLDAEGKPSPSGKIVLIGVGMSNTTQEFSVFQRMADSDPDRSRQVVIVDIAQGGKAAEQWNDTGNVGQQTWATAAQRIKAADVTPEQVQVAWLKQALIAPARFGDFPASARKLEEEIAGNLQLLRQHFPNLQMVYLSNRIYAGYATTSLNPEPYSYESAFAIRWLIEAQLAGEAKLNYDAQRGSVKAPLLLWGPYLWGDGMTPRKDGFVWNRDDLRDTDGTHPSASGQRKVAELLMAFFKSDPYAKRWYLK
jgi:hypothetical protein